MELSHRTVVEANHVRSFLDQKFGLSLEDLEEVAQSIFRGFAQVSALHPKGFNGTNGWAEGTKQMRLTMISKGWHPEDPQGQPRIVKGDQKVSITLSSGNPATGVPNLSPQTRNDKGAQTASSVSYNARQGVLFPVGEADGVVSIHPSLAGQELWVFLYYLDFEARQMRYELSQPTGMSDAQRINGWSIRLICPPMPFDPELLEQPIDDQPDIDIQVTPKTS